MTAEEQAEFVGLAATVGRLMATVHQHEAALKQAAGRIAELEAAAGRVKGDEDA